MLIFLLISTVGVEARGLMMIDPKLSGVLTRAGLVALIVGTILNLINQGDALFSGGSIHVAKALLTYLVPFLVSTHGALAGR